MHMCQAARMNDGVVHVYYKHRVSKPYVVEDFVSTVASANADDDNIAEVDEATFLKTKASHKSSPPNPNPPSNTNPTPVSPKASQKSSPHKPHPKNITKPISKASPKPKQKPNQKISQKVAPKINLESNRNKTSQAHHASAGKGKDKLEEESSSGDDDSEDNIYKPCEVETSNDDGLVEDDSDEDIDHGLRDVVLDALDPSAYPEESDSWHSEELNTLPNSEDEKFDGDSDEFSMYKEGTRFGNLELRVGMKFFTKHDFREAVREFTLQEGRRIWFKRNDRIIKCRAKCKVEKCL
ncbi:hypothetical protein PIB30_061994 [Stylosanthes scabra]|uniref:Transposase MuDR plant domain-containing protein n=1 Tax=Stylosanthes scabra TaxID=79078 RepID=A0ABU6XJY8_9FABA|nr:hypothetical protein [Stylosanthes scabra]